MKRAMAFWPRYSHRDEAKRTAVARASPRMMSRLSLSNSTNVLVGTFCPPILSIAYLGNGHDFFHSACGSFGFQIFMLDRNAVIRRHASYGCAIGRKACIANLVEERAVADLESFGGATAVPVVGLQHLENDLPLQATHSLVGDLLQ